MRVPFGLPLALGLAACWVGNSRADEPSPREVVVVPAACTAWSWAPAWVELLRVELASDRIQVRVPNHSDAPATGVAGSGVASVAVVAPCDPLPASATLTIDAGDAHETRTVRLADVEPVARPRVLAIAMADLVRTALTRANPVAGSPGSLPASQAQPTPPVTLDLRFHEAPSVAPAADPRRAQAMFGLWLTGETRLFAEGAGLGGARGGFEIPLADRFALVLDAGVEASRARDALGEIDGTVATLGASVVALGGTSELVFGVGPRAEAGAGWFRGAAAAATTSASSTTSGLAFVGLSALARFRIARQGPFWGLVGLDVGTTVYGFSAKADERHVADLVGPMLTVHLGFAWGRSGEVAGIGRGGT